MVGCGGVVVTMMTAAAAAPEVSPNEGRAAAVQKPCLNPVDEGG